MGNLPLARTATFTPGDPIPSALLNEFQDQFIGARWGRRVDNVPIAPGFGSDWTWDAAAGYMKSTGAGSWSVVLPTVVGQSIESLTFEVFGDAAANLTGNIFKRSKAGAAGASLFAIGAPAAAAAWTDVPCNIADILVADGDTVWVVFTADAANLQIGPLRMANYKSH